MPFISYAQNHEDVILWRALKGVAKGCYIDVGANHPVTDSVTCAFYERGWRGINLEPVKADFDLLERQRPSDVNLQIAAGEREGTLTLYQFGVRGLSTLSSAVTERHRAAGLTPTQTEVRVRPLRDILAENAVGEIHFLKIDVEGSEADVIKGMDFKRWRPWVLVIEATLPNSRELAYFAWEPMLLENDYRFVYFDGLSRYYVSAEREQELAKDLACQPNIFDGYVPAAVVAAREEVAQIQRKLDVYAQLPDQMALRGQVEQLEAKLRASEADLSSAREAFNTSEVRARAAERSAEELSAQLATIQADPYFTAKKTIRRLAGRLSRRFSD